MAYIYLKWTEWKSLKHGWIQDFLKEDVGTAISTVEVAAPPPSSPTLRDGQITPREQLLETFISS